MRVGRYEVRDEIARGGMGAVLRAFDPQLQREVALKLLLDGASASEARRRRFRTECQALQRVRHPNVVALLDHGEHEGVLWLAMELIEGTSLAERIRRGGPLEPREAARVTKLLSDALRSLHERGVLHRDVKPANVLVTPEGRTLLTDFGLAKDLLADPAAGAVSVVGQLLGTPGYFPPEQAQGLAEVDARADVYGLGATLYAMLSGRPPYDAPDINQLVSDMERPPPAPGTLREGIDAGLEAICLRCLEREPAQRYPSAEALSAALGEWIRGEEPPAARVSWPVLAGGGLAVGVGALAVWLALPGGGGHPSPVAVSPPRAPPAAPAPDPTTAGPQDGPEPRDERAALAGAAEAAVDSADYAGAAALWTRYLRLEPDALQALRGRALARAAQGDALGALEDLDRALERAPQDVDLLLDRAHVRRRMQDTPGAARDLDAAVAAAPGHAQVWLARALLRKESGDLAGALTDLDRSLELDPTRLLALETRYQVHRDQGRLPEALRDMERLARLRPDIPEAWINLSGLRKAMGDLEGALGDLDTACRTDPRSGLAHARRGQLRLQRGDASGAEADLRRALELGGEEASVTAHWLARALAQQGRRDEARAVLDEALRADPGDAYLLGYRGYLRHDQGDLAGAFADCSAALERDPQRVDVWLTRGLVRLDQGDGAGALADTDQALALAPDDAQIFVNRGSIHDALGDHPAALADFTRATELDPQEFRGWVARGQLLYKLKRYPEAREDFLKGVPLAPDQLRVRSNCGLARYYAGDKEGAREDWREVARRDPQGEEGQRAVVLLRELLGETFTPGGE